MTSNYYNPTDPNLIYIQSRAETDPALIEEYAEAMAAGAQFPALKAIGEQHALYIYDGYHRGQAAQKTGLPLLVSVKPGTKAEAEWLALAANQEHGLRRSNADKQKIVRLALAHDFGAKLSDRQLAAHCGVSHPTVARIREEMEATGKIYQSATRIGADGREINVGNIGSSLSIVQLESKVREWLRQKGDAPIAFLEEIKQRTDDGKALFAALGDSIAEKYRPGDLWQACNNTLDQLKQRQWRAERAQRIRAMTCLCGQQALEPVGERDGLMCTSCGRVWNCVADFENACRGCGRDLRNTLRVEGEQYCADCWEKKESTERQPGAGVKADYAANYPDGFPEKHPTTDEWSSYPVGGTCGFCGGSLSGLVKNDGFGTVHGPYECNNCHRRRHSVVDLQQGERHKAAFSPIGEKAEREKSIMCPNCDEVIFPDQDTKPNGAIVCDACKKRFASYDALMKAAERMEDYEGREEKAEALAAPAEQCSVCGRPGRFDTYGTGRRMCFQCWIRSPEHKAAGAPQATPTEDAAAELRRQLNRALHSHQGAAERWEKRRQTGLGNADLIEAIGYEFGGSVSASGPGDAGYRTKGGVNPKFWLNAGYDDRPPTLAGAALRDAARELLGIPFPADVADGEGEYDFTGMTTADLEAGLAAIERDGLPLDSPHARRLREELATRKNGAAPDPWQPSTPGLARDLTYRHQRLCMRFAGLVEKIKDIAWMDELDRRLGELEAEIASDPAKISEATR